MGLTKFWQHTTPLSLLNPVSLGRCDVGNFSSRPSWALLPPSILLPHHIQSSMITVCCSLPCTYTYTYANRRNTSMLTVKFKSLAHYCNFDHKCFINFFPVDTKLSHTPQVLECMGHKWTKTDLPLEVQGNFENVLTPI
jgi:hypothetical protein